MKLHKRTLALAVTGVAGFATAVQADEHPVNTALASTTLYGYVDTAAIWNFGTGTRQALRFNNTGSDRQDGFNLNVVKIALEKPLDEGTWSAGYKADVWYGPDSLGLPGKLGGSTEIAIKQAYVALRAPVGNGLDFKVGQFDPIVGYETVDSYTNPNFSRCYGLAIEPFAHQGVLATYQFSEVFGASAGVANTWNGTSLNSKVTGTGSESVKTYMAGIVVKAPESMGWFSGSSLYAGIVDGGGGMGASTALKDAMSLYVGGTMSTPIQGFTLGVGYDYLSAGGVKGAGNAWANAVALYASYQLTEQIKLNGRAEHASSEQGMWLSGTAADPSDRLLAYTFTVDYALWANVVTRAEFRWDHVAGGGGRFDRGQKNDLSLALNVIYKF